MKRHFAYLILTGVLLLSTKAWSTVNETIVCPRCGKYTPVSLCESTNRYTHAVQCKKCHGSIRVTVMKDKIVDVR